MSKSKFTPGPWGIQDDHGKRWIETTVGNDDTIAEIHRRRDKGSVYSCEEALANAKLIAAAPELIELANRVVEEFKNYERIGEICPFEGQPMIYASVLVELAEFAKIVQAKATA